LSSPCRSHLPAAPPALHSFPTRRSSDLPPRVLGSGALRAHLPRAPLARRDAHPPPKCAIEIGGVGVAEELRDAADGLRLVVEERSEEHTSELQSRENLVCRLLLEKKKTN